MNDILMLVVGFPLAVGGMGVVFGGDLRRSGSQHSGSQLG